MGATGRPRRTCPGRRDQLHIGFSRSVESLLAGRSQIVSGVYNHYETQRQGKRVVANLLLLVEVTIMHDLVHLGRRLVNGYDPDTNAEGRVAWSFERRAYGEIHNVTSLGLAGLVPEPD
jgi:hypothetical protein